MRTSNVKPFFWVYFGSTKSVLYPLRVIGFVASVKATCPLRLNFRVSLIRNECVIQLSLLLLLCCPVQGKSFKSGRILIQEMSRHIYRRDTQTKTRSSEMLSHDECYIVTHLKKKHSAVQIFDPEDEGVKFFETSVTLISQ